MPDGPFKGVPYLIKDLQELEGAPLTYGSKLFEHNIAEFDSGSVLRAKKAGLVIIGKTNTPEFGFVSTTESQLLGAAGTLTILRFMLVEVLAEQAWLSRQAWYLLRMPQMGVGQYVFPLLLMAWLA